MRSTSVRSSARLVITAATCGIWDMPAKVAPPLKSARTKFSVSEEWVTARPSTRVRSSSDLPEPVAPTHRPCGPMPSCAASLRSSITGWPSSPTPIGTRSRSAMRARPPGAPGVHRGGVAEAEQVGELQVGEQRFVVVPARRHPQRGQLAGQRLGGLVATGRRACPRRPRRAPDSSRSRLRVHHDGQVTARRVQLAGHDLHDRHALQALGRGEHRRRAAATPPSSTTTMCGWSSSGCPPGWKRGRPVSRPASSCLQLPGSSLISRRRARAVRLARALAVRQPLRPLPALRRAPRRPPRR